MMKKKSPPQKANSTSSKQTISFTNSRAVLALGDKLVEELQLDPYETLSRWMACYIAELITKSKKANAKDKPLIQKACFDTILSLWEHRNAMPNGKRPFEDCELIAQVIENLNPDKGTAHYSRSIRSLIVSDEESPETKKWIKNIDNIDYSAKVMIVSCLKQASQSAISKSKEWIRLAEAARVDHAPVGLLSQFSSDGGKEIELQRLVEMLKRFEKFSSIVSAFEANLIKRIDKLSNDSKNARTGKTLRTKQKVVKSETSSKRKSVAKRKSSSTKKKPATKRRASANRTKNYKN